MKAHYYPVILSLVFNVLIAVCLILGASPIYAESKSEAIFLIYCNLSTLEALNQLFMQTFLTYMSVRNHTPYRLR